MAPRTTTRRDLGSDFRSLPDLTDSATRKRLSVAAIEAFLDISDKWGLKNHSARLLLEVLARYAWMSDERIRLKLKAAGYPRTVTGIHLKLRRMGFKHEGNFYSANSLAQALGIDSHAVTRWIRSSHLKAKLRGTARTEQQNGDIYLIQEKDIRRFILEHPSHIDLRKVDQLWFLDYVEYDLDARGAEDHHFSF